MVRISLRAVCSMLALTLAIAVGGFLNPRAAQAEPVSYVLDPTHLTVSFLVDHIGYAKTLGIFREVSGSFTFDEETNTLSDLQVVVATSSVDTFLAARDDHVRGKDFLDVETFPEMTFVGTEAVANDADSGVITGDLTLLGTTQPLELSVTKNKSGPYPFGANPPNTLGLSLRGHLMRSAFGMVYGVDNGLVGDRIDLIIEVEATAQ